MERITTFKFMDLKSTVDLDNPTDIFAIFEDYRRTDKHNPVRIFMCRQIVLGRRDLIDVYSLKKRQYLGITSMDSELSLIGANMALVSLFKSHSQMLRNFSHFVFRPEKVRWWSIRL